MLLTDIYLMNFTWSATVKGGTDVEAESGKKRLMEKKNDSIKSFLQKNSWGQLLQEMTTGKE